MAETANTYRVKIDGDIYCSIDTKLLQNDLRHFEALVQDTRSVRSHVDGLSKKRHFGSGTDWTTSAGEQALSPKRGRSHTHGLDAPTASRVDRSSAAAEGHTPYMRLKSHEDGASKYDVEHGSPSDAAKALPAPKIIASDGQDAIVHEPQPPFAHPPAADSQHSSAHNEIADGDDGRAPVVQQSSRRHQPPTESPQQSQRTSPQAQQPLAEPRQPVPLDLQREYNLVREHISRKDIASGLPAIASIAALRSCMADLKDAVKMSSEAWFLLEREKIDEELVRGGFAGLPTL